MHELILWAGFLGAWLLVVGPVQQASIELSQEDAEMDRVRATMAAQPPPPPVPRWWWLLPPVYLLLRRRRRRRYRDQMLLAMSAEEYRVVAAFVNKATGWLFVGVGGFLIASKETYELAEGLEWPIAVFWVLLVVMLALAIANTAARSRHNERKVALRKLNGR